MTVSHATGNAGAWLDPEACLRVFEAVHHEIERLPWRQAAFLERIKVVLQPAAAAHLEALEARRTSAAGSEEVPQPEANGRVVRMTTNDAADALGVGARQVTNLLDRGVLDGEKVGGHWLIDPASVARLVEARR